MDKKTVVLALIVVLVLTSIPFSLYREREGKIKELEKGYENLEAELLSTKEQLERLNESITHALAELQHKDILLREVEHSIARLNQSLQAKTEWIYTLGIREGGGIAIPVCIEIREGKGRLLIDTEDALFDTDLQIAVKKALYVAQNITAADLSEKDVIFSIINPLEDEITLSGQSAGAAITVGLIALIMDKEINRGVIITGTIEKNGSIGAVSDIRAKAEAAKYVNATTLLVPRMQGIPSTGIDIDILEVYNITEAMEHMLV